MDTLILDRTTWDLLLDTNGNIAVATDPYSVAQDAASAVKLFIGELWYDTTQGVPYFADILAQFPNIALMKAKFNAAALTVPEVTAAQTFIASIDRNTRRITGQVQVTTKTGASSAANFATVLPSGPGPG